MASVRCKSLRSCQVSTPFGLLNVNDQGVITGLETDAAQALASRYGDNYTVIGDAPAVVAAPVSVDVPKPDDPPPPPPVKHASKKTKKSR